MQKLASLMKVENSVEDCVHCAVRYVSVVFENVEFFSCPLMAFSCKIIVPRSSIYVTGVTSAE